MSTIRVTCPHCVFSRDLPAEKVPDRPVRVTCPRCTHSFEFQKPASPAPPQESQPPSPPPSPEQSRGSPPPATPPKPVVKKPTRTPPPASARRLEVGETFSGSWNACRERRMLLVGLLLVAVAGGAYFLRDMLPPLKPGTAGIQGRQVITIPPPGGEFPSGFPPPGGAGGSSTTPPPAGPSPTIEIGPAPGAAPSGSQFRATDVSVFIYAVNAPGTIRINGQNFRVIKAEPDMQYNINAFGDHFRAGENTIEFDVTPRPGDARSLLPSIQMKVSMEGRVLGEWRLSDRDGWPRSVTVTMPEGKTP